MAIYPYQTVGVNGTTIPTVTVGPIGSTTSINTTIPIGVNNIGASSIHPIYQNPNKYIEVYDKYIAEMELRDKCETVREAYELYQTTLRLARN